MPVGEESVAAAPAVEPAPTEAPVPRAGVRRVALVSSPETRAALAPVRGDLAQSLRRVALVPGVSQTEPRAPDLAPSPAPAAGERLVYSRATVVVGAGGRRTVVFSERSATAVDIGRPTECGAEALQAGARLRGLRSTPLQRGMEGAAVLGAQQLLCAAGYAVPQTGTFDSGTEAAVRAFQTDHNEAALPQRRLGVDGVLGVSTRRELEARLRDRLRN